MLRKVLNTEDDWVLTLMRVVVGIVIFPHGAQLLLGWFGGYGYHASIAGFAREGIPPVFGFLAIVSEFLGSIGLIIGFMARVAALGIAVDMVVAIFKVHLPYGFFMNWLGTQKGEGYEFHLLALALLIAIFVRGAGAFSLDHAVSRSLTRSASTPVPSRA
ncbi:MAG TPA: DoxX family protein [Terriglobales bacterium]|nr:DoxX family protein [Terriglobales bacterium]